MQYTWKILFASAVVLLLTGCSVMSFDRNVIALFISLFAAGAALWQYIKDRHEERCIKKASKLEGDLQKHTDIFHKSR